MWKLQSLPGHCPTACKFWCCYVLNFSSSSLLLPIVGLVPSGIFFPFPRNVSFPGLQVAQMLISNSNQPTPNTWFLLFHLNDSLYSLVSPSLLTKPTQRETVFSWSQNLKPEFLFLPTNLPNIPSSQIRTFTKGSCLLNILYADYISTPILWLPGFMDIWADFCSI